MRVFVYLLFLLTITQSIGRLQAHLPYEVRWLGTSLDTVAASRDRNVIHCYPGTEKTIEKIWRTTEIHIFIKNDTFDLHVGTSPDMVQRKYKIKFYMSINFDQAERTLSVDPFNQTCLMVSTDDSYGIQASITGVDRWRVLNMWIGLVTVFFSRILSRQPETFYLCATFSGIFMLLLFLFTQLYVFQMGLSIIEGWTWTTAALFFRLLWIMEMFKKYAIYCMVVTGVLSSLLAYRIGPPKNPRSKNIMEWMIKVIGAFMIYCSSAHEEASAVIIVLSVVMTYLLELLNKHGRLVRFLTYSFGIICFVVLDVVTYIFVN